MKARPRYGGVDVTMVRRRFVRLSVKYLSLRTTNIIPIKIHQSHQETCEHSPPPVKEIKEFEPTCAGVRIKGLIVFKEDAVSSTSIRLSYPQGKHIGLLDMKVMALFAVDDYPLNFKMNARPCRNAIRTTPLSRIVKRLQHP